MEPDHQQQVQQDVDQAGNHQINHGAFCIPDRPHDRRAEIVQHIGRHSQEIDPHIQRRSVDHVRRRIHQAQQVPGSQESERAYADAHKQRQSHGRMLCLPHSCNVPGAVIPGDHHARPDTQAHENIHQQIDQRTCGGYRRQRFMAGIVSHHNHVRRVIQQLQDPCQDQRTRKRKNPRKQRAFRHIDFVTAALPPVQMKHNLISIAN